MLPGNDQRARPGARVTDDPVGRPSVSFFVQKLLADAHVNEHVSAIPTLNLAVHLNQLETLLQNLLALRRALGIQKGILHAFELAWRMDGHVG